MKFATSSSLVKLPVPDGAVNAARYLAGARKPAQVAFYSDHKVPMAARRVPLTRHNQSSSYLTSQAEVIPARRFLVYFAGPPRCSKRPYIKRQRSVIAQNKVK
jgi:hypothetical protein